MLEIIRLRHLLGVSIFWSLLGQFETHGQCAPKVSLLGAEGVISTDFSVLEREIPTLAAMIQNVFGAQERVGPQAVVAYVREASKRFSQKAVELFKHKPHLIKPLGLILADIQNRISEGFQKWSARFHRRVPILSRVDRRHLQELQSEVVNPLWGKLGEVQALLLLDHRLIVSGFRPGELPSTLDGDEGLRYAAEFRQIVQRQIDLAWESLGRPRSAKVFYVELRRRYDHLFTWRDFVDWTTASRVLYGVEIDFVAKGRKKEIAWVEVKLRHHPVGEQDLFDEHHPIFVSLERRRELALFLGLQNRVEIEAIFPNGITPWARDFLEKRGYRVHAPDVQATSTH